MQCASMMTPTTTCGHRLTAQWHPWKIAGHTTLVPVRVISMVLCIIIDSLLIS